MAVAGNFPALVFDMWRAWHAAAWGGALERAPASARQNQKRNRKRFSDTADERATGVLLGVPPRRRRPGRRRPGRGRRRAPRRARDDDGARVGRLIFPRRRRRRARDAADAASPRRAVQAPRARSDARESRGVAGTRRARRARLRRARARVRDARGAGRARGRRRGVRRGDGSDATDEGVSGGGGGASGDAPRRRRARVSTRRVPGASPRRVRQKNVR